MTTKRRIVAIEGVAYSVPRYVSRTSGGWRVRIVANKRLIVDATIKDYTVRSQKGQDQRQLSLRRAETAMRGHLGSLQQGYPAGL